uniref:Phytanoyl-CoA dioxygenase n=1 Tax=Eucampia antarctica TaxID=49252 RepID=A0A7S2VZW3_9STRA|mmetsp:Transcript_14593/g.14065  ORF Transcript_14593/g.14065 Transcript_14593/m.14065 type:complete len:416 (+) Transcript_14593:84-1331(+)|eukprot:CAMPEP_0197833908 /NCGR_PEP_ID=MMETSP1437-20131217/20527_1 /TAXON_ID=49252 ORGANISM="Eucampia antarctica, Strain CCMP1452" /NCGR_SAMPLE_ID=MMETSP1437 /ASSEMBLY_ACC=CAM_ASM_001096 /LENGTH=415 /DNA_ID=CAMNT_0043438233 /DNA_START=14 /DNA_END=1261 /DNA_ORIENTATION=+
MVKIAFIALILLSVQEASAFSSNTADIIASRQPSRTFSRCINSALHQSSIVDETKTVSPVAPLPDMQEESTSLRREKILSEPNLWEYNFGLQDPGIKLPHGIVDRKTAPEQFQITSEQIEILERDGVVHIKGVFDDEWVDYLRKATAHQVDNPHFWAFAGTASKLYDYIQRNVWQTNKAFANFYYHSAMGHVLSQCGKTDEIRISTDLLMVNPNKGFKWHQDNQNGPISWEEGIRFWVTMDETPKEYGAPVYLKGSHRNNAVDEHAVFVDIDQEGLDEYRDQLAEFRTMPGDMLIWHPRTVHKVDGPSDGIWTSYRRVLGGTAAKGGSIYRDKTGTGGVLSDLGRHGLENGHKLESPFFPVMYPRFNKKEALARDEGVVGRSPKDIIGKLGGLAGKASGEKFFSFFQVLGSQAKN